MCQRNISYLGSKIQESSHRIVKNSLLKLNLPLDKDENIYERDNVSDMNNYDTYSLIEENT
jgi:hypothetical protein